MGSFQLDSIGTFYAAEQYPYDAARQAAMAVDNAGRVCLEQGRNYEQAVADLDGFSHIWLIYWFDRNVSWKPKVQPPRGPRKVGVFASRAPYRPNPIGLSCVELIQVDGLVLHVRGHDLLNNTPILDIKPYLPYADSFPEAITGWVQEAAGEDCVVDILPAAELQLVWLEERGAGCIRAFLLQQLSSRPTDAARKRVREIGNGLWEIAYRTWRACFRCNPAACRTQVISIYSGYSAQDLIDTEDRYADKRLHREYNQVMHVQQDAPE